MSLMVKLSREVGARFQIAEEDESTSVFGHLHAVYHWFDDGNMTCIASS